MQASPTPTPPAAGSGSSPAFEFVESIVTDESTGARLAADKVNRGTTRLEVLKFRARAPLQGLQRTVINYKHFPVVGFQKVGVDVVEMGDYAAQEELHTFDMPKAKIPNLYLAKGKYRIHLTVSMRDARASAAHTKDCRALKPHLTWPLLLIKRTSLPFGQYAANNLPGEVLTTIKHEFTVY